MPNALRWFLTPRFSLRALLVAVTVGCATLGWRANRLWQNQRAIDAIYQSKLLLSLNPRQTQFDPPRLSFFGKVNIQEVEVYPEFFMGETYPEFPKLWGDLALIAPLRKLTLTNIDLPSKAQSRAWNRTNLVTEAAIIQCAIQDDALESAIEQMPKLKSLTINGGEFDATRLSCLSKCEQLEAVQFDEATLAAGSVSSFVPKQLRRLRLGAFGSPIHANLSEADFRAVSKLDRLEELSLHCFPGVSTAAVEFLKCCPSLKKVTIGIACERIEELQVAKNTLEEGLPGCEVHLFELPDR